MCHIPAPSPLNFRADVDACGVLWCVTHTHQYSFFRFLVMWSLFIDISALKSCHSVRVKGRPKNVCCGIVPKGEGGSPRGSIFHCKCKFYLSFIILQLGQRLNNDYSISIELREAVCRQNGWIFGKVPNSLWPLNSSVLVANSNTETNLNGTNSSRLLERMQMWKALWKRLNDDENDSHIMVIIVITMRMMIILRPGSKWRH